MKWIWNRCHRRQEVSLLAADALADDERREMEDHLSHCQECRGYYHEIKAVAAPLANWEKSLSSVEPTPAAKRRWDRAIHEADAPHDTRQPLLKNVWRELIWPSRHAWAGMAALWMVMLAINGRLSDQPASGAEAHSSSAREVMEAWQEQNRVLAELTQPAATISPAPAVLPRPRSDRERGWAII